MEKNLKILMICKSLPWSYKGGIQSHTWDLSRELVTLGHEVHILTAGSLLKGQKAYQKQGVDIVEIPYIPGRYLWPLSKLAEEFFFNYEAKNWINKHEQEFDVIHLQGRSGYLYGRQKTNKPVVNTVHGLCANELSQNMGLQDEIYRKVTADAEQQLIDNADKLISVSQALKAEMIEKNNCNAEKVAVINNGVNMSTEQLASKSSKSNKLLFVGRIAEVKGLDTLIEMMEYVDEEVELNVIGDGPMRSSFERKVKESSFSHRIHLVGEKTRSEIDEYMKDSLALVLPSRYETQGIVLLEAGVNGIPVIASDLEAIRESVLDGVTGFLCKVGFANQFGEAADYLYKNQEKAAQMGKEAREHVASNFSWTSIGARTEKVYFELLPVA
ncbi:glycosyltransferase family 4 protein [Reichenbachiella versicolor]|uniref:glycosyltransferase family 4 protein n=1 Tax=Reichenbachiella versicolor TaxID=1821036 RepID=UPI0013A5A1B8|nr:glycosyltransferase family 4 protein [Reichenbachiella versicolor]